jgi:hypothetical protein
MSSSSPNINSALPDELSYLIAGFLPSQPTEQRTKAYLALSAFCSGVRSSQAVKEKQPDPATEALVRVFAPIIVGRLSETSQDALLCGVTLHTALFQIDSESAAAIFARDGLVEAIMDCLDLHPSVELDICVAHLLGQACGYSECRSILSSDAVKWIETRARQRGNNPLQAAAATAMIKLSRGRRDPGPAETSYPIVDEDKLAAALKDMVISDAGRSTSSAIADAIEGLAYLSIQPTIKKALCDDTSFLKGLFALAPRRKSTVPIDATFLYGILVVVCNLSNYRPRLTEEQSHIEKLKKMARSQDNSMEDSPLNNDDCVKTRVQKLLEAGVLEVFVGALSKADTSGVRLAVGKALLNIVTDKANRGKVLQSGGARLLMSIIKHGLVGKDTNPDSSLLEPIQALAKLAITSSPIQVFGPNPGALYDAIRPFSILLQHPSSTSLQHFEALMALTNIASHSAEAATRVNDSNGLVNKAELLLFEDHTLIRRAAMELVCNLIAGSDSAFERYGGATNSSSAKSKLQIIVAMADVDDLPTRLAASGALATLTCMPNACQNLLSLQTERHRVFPVLTLLIEPSAVSEPGAEQVQRDVGLVHRGVVCVHNLAIYIKDNGIGEEIKKDAIGSGLVKALLNSEKDSKMPVEIKSQVVQILNILRLH